MIWHCLYAAECAHWMMDSGATTHITPHLSDFKDYTPCHGTVHLGDKSTISQVGVGSIVFKTSPGAPPITSSGVLHIPGVRTRFMSMCALANKGAEVASPRGHLKSLLIRVVSVLAIWKTIYIGLTSPVLA